ncbi:hypothetical protein IW150_003404 [Coemansia sp. RSA 2607]|nr:hypothetical protein IW150_003404 [Coemansia sp. RSA 2607]
MCNPAYTRYTPPNRRHSAYSPSVTSVASTSASTSEKPVLAKESTKETVTSASNIVDNATINAAVTKAVNNAVESIVVARVTSAVRAEVANAVSIGVKSAINQITDEVLSRIQKKDKVQIYGCTTSLSSAPVFDEYRPITKDEINMVKSALPGATWRMCSSGHWYAVGDCGNAVVSGKCIDCKTIVGSGRR